MRGITCMGFVGDRPVESMTAEERTELGARLKARMGRAMEDRFKAAPEEYAKALHRLAPLRRCDEQESKGRDLCSRAQSRRAKA